ncbi:MAG: T9SS type A sorting domain-containing protein, partial [Saprospiraceae bacterium]
IAQEVEKVLPNLVKDTKVQFEEAVRNPESEERWHEEYKAINYQGFIPLLTQGIKEQQNSIENLTLENEKLVNEMADLRQANVQLEQRLARIEALLNQDDTSPVQPLQGAILEQNQPNPTNGITTIRYFIPAAVQHAQLQITTLDGKLVKTISVTERGWQQTELYANQLSEAQYFYTLYVDNQIIETKKMVLLK